MRPDCSQIQMDLHIIYHHYLTWGRYKFWQFLQIPQHASPLTLFSYLILFKRIIIPLLAGIWCHFLCEPVMNSGKIPVLNFFLTSSAGIHIFDWLITRVLIVENVNNVNVLWLSRLHTVWREKMEGQVTLKVCIERVLSCHYYGGRKATKHATTKLKSILI